MGVQQMADGKYTILSGNVTVLGNFNPAILRPGFIQKELSNWGLGEGELVSPEQVPLITDIRYDKVRLFMDPNRMVVEDTKLSAIQDMSSPGIVRDYLNKLPYTPLQMIGLNFSGEAEPVALSVVWSNAGDPNRVAKILDKAGHHLPLLTLSYAFHGLKPLLAEAILVMSEAEGLRIQLTLNKTAENEKTRLLFNAEFQDLARNRSRIEFLADHFLEVGQKFSMLLDLLGEEAT